MRNQTGYMTAKDMDTDIAGHIKQFLASRGASTADYQLIPYGVTPALQQWMTSNEVRGLSMWPRLS